MVATVVIVRKTTASPGATPGSPGMDDITEINTRANAYDGHSVADTTYPIRIPELGNTNYSYWVTTRLYCSVTPGGTIDNIRWFPDDEDNFGTGVSCIVAKALTGASDGYRQATGTPGVTGTELTQVNHTGLDEAPVDAFTYDSVSPYVLNGSITNPSTGEFGDHIVYQIVVGDTALPGASGQETFTWRFDET